uniref:Type-4 uracil-DNA glycosylase n=1 Tax=Candidatus Kentrum sp. SD TaxID=2126332 RepID=A0A450Y586_9GAMM|nr:MAG: DNA polymerase [Candidatus Kentron sp. SD]VFK40223.1 MAG: DNA polymerase [Candidatus Kentron sp. SD]
MMDEKKQRYLDILGIPVWKLRAADQVSDASCPFRTTTISDDIDDTKRARAPGDGPDRPSVTNQGPPQSGVDSPRALSPSLSASATSIKESWENLRAEVSACTACGLHRTRTQTVFGGGSWSADWMFIGEAPGADEDRQGEPFVGRAGRLLNAMIEAIGLKREEVYIANILKCRPPNNREPEPSEALSCESFLLRQITLVNPRIILAVGRIAAQNLLATTTPIGRMRGRRFTFRNTGIPLVVIYHPAYLLRSPLQKRRTWEDLLVARAVHAEAIRDTL